MSKSARVVNVVIAGLGGQGVLKASDIVADVAFRAGLDVKKAEIHGMSQRGGSVTSDVRYGERVHSPMVTAGEADYLVVLEETQVEVNRGVLREGGALLTPGMLAGVKLKSEKCVNVAMLGALSARLEFGVEAWRESIAAHLPEKVLAMNLEAFEMGRQL
jgi:indolepyruvate ferredoxin oxidoreductase beta subunit